MCLPQLEPHSLPELQIIFAVLLVNLESATGCETACNAAACAFHLESLLSTRYYSAGSEVHATFGVEPYQTLFSRLLSVPSSPAVQSFVVLPSAYCILLHVDEGGGTDMLRPTSTVRCPQVVPRQMENLQTEYPIMPTAQVHWTFLALSSYSTSGCHQLFQPRGTPWTAVPAHILLSRIKASSLLLLECGVQRFYLLLAT
jgi:hypothetical protein